MEQFTRLYSRTLGLFVNQDIDWFRRSLKTFGHYLESHPRSPYQEYFDLFYVPLEGHSHSIQSADAVFIPFPEPFLDDNSPNHKRYRKSGGYRQHSSKNDNVAGLVFDKQNALEPKCHHRNAPHHKNAGIPSIYSAEGLQTRSIQYKHAYFKPVDHCDYESTFRKGGKDDRFLLLSLCVGDASHYHYELCIPMGPAQQFGIDDIIDPYDEFSPPPEYTEKNIQSFLNHLERQYNPDNPLANHHIEELLGRGISAQVMRSVSFLRSAAIKRVIKEVPDTQSAEEFILTAQVNMRLLTMAEIDYLPLIYFYVPARTKGKFAIYGVQKKCDSHQFLDHMFEDPSLPMPAMENLLDDIIGLLAECDITNALQYEALSPQSSGFSLAVDPQLRQLLL